MDPRTIATMLSRPSALVRVFLWLPVVLLLTVCTKTEETAPASEETPTEVDAPAALDLWDGVPPLVQAEGDVAETIEPRPGPAKPKTVAERVELPFDPETFASGPPVVAPAKLEVTRYGPEGSVGLVGAVRVAFNQAMVPLAAVETLTAKPIPVELDPKPAGQWRWLGTRVLVFEPDGRMPLSTDYKVTVPAGVASTSGSKLASPVSWEFSTPSLALQTASPHNGASHVDLDPTITLTFNQPIEKTAMFGALQFRAKGKTIAVERVADPAPSEDETVQWRQGRTLVLRPTDKLIPNTSYSLLIPAGTFGEGPVRSSPITVAFTTYPPLRLSAQRCTGKECWSTNGISLTATNQIVDPKVADKVTVSPAIEDMVVSANWGGIHIGGRVEGNTTYRVDVKAGVMDRYGQTLAKPFSASVKLGPPYPSLSIARPNRSPAVIERGGDAELSMEIAGLRQVQVQARSLQTDELLQFFDAYLRGDKAEWPSHLPAATSDETLDVRKSLKRREPFTVDLASLLTPGRNAVWLAARSEEIELYGWKQRLHATMLAQVTDLGIAAAMDRDSGLIQLTRLSDGNPVVGAKLVLANGGSTLSELWSGTTDDHGLATPTFSGEPRLIIATTADDSAFLRVEGNDLRGQWRYSGRKIEDEPRAFIYTDRTPYKPGEIVHLAGIIRKEERGTAGGIALWATDVTAQYVVNDARGIEVVKGDVKIGKFGTFSLDIETDPDGGTGNYSFALTFKGIFGSDRVFYHAIPVETYRTPEFKVAVQRDDSTPLLYGDTLVADVKADYLHGAPLVGGQVAWTMTRSESGFTPPGEANTEFQFGSRVQSHYGRHWGWVAPIPSRPLKTGTGTLDAKGALRIDKELLAIEPDPKPAATPAPTKPKEPKEPAASTYTINATVTDESRQAIAGSAAFVVHPAAVYVGLRSERQVLKEGERAQLSAIVVDLEGKRDAGRDIELAVVRRETKRTAVEKDGRWTFEYETTESEAGACTLSSANAPVDCEVTVGAAGTYVVRGKATDDKGNAAHSELTFYVHGKDAVVWEDNEQRVDLVADKDKYAPGDTAVVMLRSPFTEARGVVVVEREGIAKQVPVHLKGGSHIVEIPIDESMIPNVTLSALLTRGRTKVAGVPSDQDLGRPSVATGRLDLDVDDANKRLVVELTPDAERIAPGGKLTVAINTRTASGAATKAAVALMVVDEGVLSLMGHQTPDPLTFFHRKRQADVWLHAMHSNVVAQGLEAVTALAKSKPASDFGYGSGGLGLIGTGRGGGGTGEGTIGLLARESGHFLASPAAPAPASRPGRSLDKADAAEVLQEESNVFDPSAAMAQPVSLRDVFATTAYFNAEIITDDFGAATVEIDMPENLTTFRIMAVAVDPAEADRMGNGQATVTVRKPIMVRPSLPRFANFSDRFEASVMVDNLTDDPQNVLVGTRGLNVELSGSDQKFVEVPAGESREVRFGMAAKEVGRMRLQFAVMSNAGRDATEVTIPVHYPATAKAFADYGVVDSTIQRVLEPPADALPDFGGLELSMSSTALSGLEDAVQYLVTYPYECAEQTSSRILPIFALGDIIEEFPIASVSDRGRRDALANDGIARLLKKQNPDGGFGYWRRGESWPYLTNWVTFALLEGKKKGYEVDEAALNKALSYVENFVRYGHDTRWGRYYAWTSRAFGLWLLSGEGKGEGMFERVWSHRGEMPLYARAQLMAVAHRFGKTTEVEQVRKQLDKAVVESARTIHFAENASEADAQGLRVLMHSNVQTDAITLMALLETAPSDPMLPKVMAGIMADRDPRRGGRWGTTHANAWALLGASRYYDTVEGTEPDFTARLWIDDNFGTEQQFKGRSMTTIDQRIGMRAIQGAEQREITLEKDGPGKLYYRLGLRYAPADLKLPAADQGFLVYREYEALPDAAGTLDPEAVKRTDDGGWLVKAGTDVRITIHVVARDRANYVVVDDALPAGFEGQNPRFATSSPSAAPAASSTPSTSRWWWPWFRFDHTDLRDDRMLLFADSMPAGVYSYSYTARATTLGTFHLPPIKAEAMYEPERFGHSSSGEVRVVE